MTTEPEPGSANGQLSYANERTMLAWIRTSLGLTTAGLAISQLLPPFGFAGGRRVVGVPLIALGVWSAAAAYRTWSRNERAIEDGRPLVRSHLALVVTAGVVLVGALALVLAAIGNVST